MKVLVTGANGFIGSNIVRELCKQTDCQVTGLVRKGSDTKFIDQYNIPLIRADLLSLKAEELNEFDKIIHVGAKVGDWGKYKDFYEANVKGTVKLFESCSKSDFIFISSNAVLGEEDQTKPKSEDAGYKPVLKYWLEDILPCAMNHYRLTKALSEMILIKKARDNKRNLTIIRPVWVYGPREFNAGPYEYCKTIDSGICLMPGCKTNRFHTIYVEDLARIIKEICHNQKKGINTYNAGNPDVKLMHEYWGGFCSALKRSQPYYLPKWLLYIPATLMEALFEIFKTANPPLFTRARIYMFYASNVYNVDKLISDYNIKKFTPFEKAVKKTVRWWKLNKYL